LEVNFMTENGAEFTLMVMLLACLLTGNVRRRPQILVSTQQPDIEKYLLLFLLVLTMALMPVLDAVVPVFEFADFRFSDEMAWVGSAFGCGAIFILWRSRADLARYQAQALSSRMIVPEVGVYRYVRHPVYTAMLLWSVAQLFMLQNWLAGFAAAASFLLVYTLRMPFEEEALLQRFGHHYLDYMARTGRILPRCSSAGL
jgi:protein-S-isoprenylcysteine O-methyltransferase Ste14